MHMIRNVALLLLCLGIVVTGCARSKVTRVDTGETIDLSGKWNDTDSQLVSDEMIQDALNHQWLPKFRSEHGNKSPVVIVGTVQNLSHEHINVQTFVKDLERALINSGEVEFVAGKEEREEIREERKDQAIHASESTAKARGEEIGADYMLKGTIGSIIDKIEG
ncbi:MAG: penicillin-binding protein activator LpoB, partial [bacterium]